MGTLNSWDVTDANNNLAPPDGWPENTMQYSDVNDTGRAVQGTIKRWFSDNNGSLDAGGVADAYTLTLNETGYTAYFDGMEFVCTIPDSNSVDNPTMDVNGIGATTIVDSAGNALGIAVLLGGQSYKFQHDGTNLRLVSGYGPVNGSDGEFLTNTEGAIDAPGNLVYDSTDDIVIAAPGLRVEEWQEFDEQSALNVSGGAVAGRGYLWVRNDSPSVLVFTNDDGTDQVLGAGGVGTPGLPFNSVQFNAAGSFGGSADFTYNGTFLVLGSTTRIIASASSVLANTAYSFDSDASTGRTMRITCSGFGDALDVSGSSEFTGSVLIDGGNSLTLEDGSGTMILDQDGGTESRIRSGLDGGNLRLWSVEPGSDIYFTHRDGGDLFTRESARFDSFSCVFNSSDIEIVRIDSNNVDINRPIDMSDAAAGQIQFPATQNPSTNVNTLDDYQEEEQFVVTMTPSGSGSISIDTSNDELAYIKIGRLVWLQGEISVASVSAPTGEGVDIELPFTSLDAPGIHSQDQLYQSCRVINLSGLPDAFYECFIDRGATTMRIRDLDGSPNLADNFQATTIVAINVMYIADA